MTAKIYKKWRKEITNFNGGLYLFFGS